MEVPSRAKKVRFGAFEVDLRSGELRKHGLRVKLQDQPFQILALLLERPGEVITREELQRQLWPADTFVDFDVGLNTAIKRLRDALGDTAESPRYVETVPRRGYRFVASVKDAASLPLSTSPPQDSLPEAAQAPTFPPAEPISKTSAARPTPQLQPRMRWVGVLALVVILATLAGLNVSKLRHPLFRRPAAGRIRSIAVLPLENLSRDPDQEYFADGMTEALITDLSKIGELRVISRTSVMHYKGSRKTLPEIARELNVDAMIEGAVLRSGNRVRITAQLIEASTDRHLWAESYERDLRDLLTLQGEVAREVAREVHIKLTRQEQTRLLARHPVDPEAAQAYLRGRYELNTKQFDQSIEHFKQATAKEPEYAEAWASLAEAYDALSYGFASELFSSSRVDVPELRSQYVQVLAKSEAAALNALRLDESLPQAHVSLGQVLIDGDWAWEAAEKEFQRAISLDANDAGAHQAYGEHLMAWGRLNEATVELKRARDLDPFAWKTRYLLARTLSAGGRYDDALEQWRQLISLGFPAAYQVHRRMAMAYEGKGSEREAFAELVAALKAVDKTHGTRRAEDMATEVTKKYSSAGYAEARKAFFRGETLEETGAGPIWLAADYAELGNHEKAFEWLNKTVQMNNSNRKFIRVDDRLKALHGDPRFQDFVRNLGFPPMPSELRP
jgi:TolB-like protein/DNA-binding winged helix-turn-helix (wHTH) protein/Flp pilus assembly protein TadD